MTLFRTYSFYHNCLLEFKLELFNGELELMEGKLELVDGKLELVDGELVDSGLDGSTISVKILNR